MTPHMEGALTLNRATDGYGAKYLELLKASGRGVDEIMPGGEALWRHLGLPERSVSVMRGSAADGWAVRELDACATMGVSVIAIDTQAYPDELTELDSPPLALYIRGRLPMGGHGRRISIVGTRRASAYGKNSAHTVGAWAGSCGMCVVSGGASGVDGAGHEGCMSAQCPTVAVMGTGVDRVYPASHEDMFRRICDRGALVSEYPLGTGGQKWRFPWRNRIIAALSQRLVVVEAPHASGTMSTARFAMALGREVWAVPGRMDEPTCAGSNQLIFDGALPLVSRDVFVSACGGSLFAPLIKEELDEKSEAVLSLLCVQGDRTVDNLAAECKMSAADTLRTIAVLQARGKIYSSGPGRYRVTASR